MDIKGFKKLITKSVVKNSIIGGGIFLFGAFIFWLVISGADPEMTTGIMVGCIILASICVLIGFGISFSCLKDYYKVKRGNHPVVNALINEDKNHLVWVYQHITQVKNGGANHQIWTFDKNGEKFILNLKAKRIDEAMIFLSKSFPNAVFGYSDEIRVQMEQRFGRKL